jgi:DNA-binding protein HU-beta
MAEKTTGIVSRTELARRVSARLPSASTAEDIILTTFGEIARIVAGGGRVTVNNFGTFRSHDAPERIGHNPRNGEVIQIPATTVMRFTARGHTKVMVRTGNSNGSIRRTGSK